MTIREIDPIIQVFGVRILSELGDVIEPSREIPLSKPASHLDPDFAYAEFIKCPDPDTAIRAESFDGVTYRVIERAVGPEINRHPLFRHRIYWSPQ